MMILPKSSTPVVPGPWNETPPASFSSPVDVVCTFFLHYGWISVAWSIHNSYGKQEFQIKILLEWARVVFFRISRALNYVGTKCPASDVWEQSSWACTEECFVLVSRKLCGWKQRQWLILDIWKPIMLWLFRDLRNKQSIIELVWKNWKNYESANKENIIGICITLLTVEYSGHTICWTICFCLFVFQTIC